MGSNSQFQERERQQVEVVHREIGERTVFTAQGIGCSTPHSCQLKWELKV